MLSRVVRAVEENAINPWEEGVPQHSARSSKERGQQQRSPQHPSQAHDFSKTVVAALFTCCR